MLVPAVSYKAQIEKEFEKLYYTEDMLLMTGSISQWCPNIPDVPGYGDFSYAIVSNDKLIGYIAYQVDYYTSKAYNFGLVSFDKGNPIVGRDLFAKMEELVDRFHRVEWRMVGGNPVEKNYDKFCERHHGNKYVLKDSIKDYNGNYRNDVIYEIISDR